MTLRLIASGIFVAALGWAGTQALVGPCLAQTPSQPSAAPATQEPTLGAHAPQAQGQPSWMEGMTPAQASSPLHPNIANMLGHPAKDIPVDHFKVPAGFKIELWAGDMQEARSMTIGAKGTVFVGQRVHDGVNAITD